MAAARAVVLATVVGCAGQANEAPAPTAPLVANGLCVTKGVATIGARVTEPTVRAVKLGSSGNDAKLTFVGRGDSDRQRALASGQLRRQIGIKLRAQDSCNVVYAMWRLDDDARAAIEVSVKSNPSDASHAECGTKGYTKVTAVEHHPVAPWPVGEPITLRAAIDDHNELRAWIGDQLVWRGTLPETARAIHGPAGVRSDNVAYDLVALETTAGDVATRSTCITGGAD